MEPAASSGTLAQPRTLRARLESVALALARALWSAHRRPELGTEQITLLAALFFALLCNDPFWEEALAGRDWTAGTWSFALGTFVLLTGVHFVVLCAVTTRWTVKPVLFALFIATAAATFYMSEYTVFLDADVLRAILHTEPREARELLTPRLLPHLLLFSCVPIALLQWVRVRRRTLIRAAAVRAAALALGVAATLCGGALSFRDLSAFIRNRKEVRYLVTPGNLLVGAAHVLSDDAARAARPRVPIGVDAVLGPRPDGARPRVVVIVVGETARAANWGLSGYSRQTTPELAGLGVLNFPEVTACGTSTEVSVPCMFAMVGRRDYDESRIEREESVLHVLNHAGVATLWRDNQTGCKHVCDGLANEALSDARNPSWCRGDHCLDEILVDDGLAAAIAARADSDLVIVLHPLGNHGPSYYARYPAAFRRFAPTCDTTELGRCTHEQIVNSYDNALLYADHVVARAIRVLQEQTSHDAALLYVSDHGESLGENGLYLHGVPYAIAPAEQTRVPMVAWLDPGLRRQLRLDSACLRRRALQPASHDNLAHTVLGLLDVRTNVYERALDLFSGCRDAQSRGLLAYRAPHKFPLSFSP